MSILGTISTNLDPYSPWLFFRVPIISVLRSSIWCQIELAHTGSWTHSIEIESHKSIDCFPDHHQIIIGKGISNLQALAGCAEEAVSAEGRKCPACILCTHQDMDIGYIQNPSVAVIQPTSREFGRAFIQSKGRSPLKKNRKVGVFPTWPTPHPTPKLETAFF